MENGNHCAENNHQYVSWWMAKATRSVRKTSCEEKTQQSFNKAVIKGCWTGATLFTEANVTCLILSQEAKGTGWGNALISPSCALTIFGQATVLSFTGECGRVTRHNLSGHDAMYPQTMSIHSTVLIHADVPCSRMLHCNNWSPHWRNYFSAVNKWSPGLGWWVVIVTFWYYSFKLVVHWIKSWTYTWHRRLMQFLWRNPRRGRWISALDTKRVHLIRVYYALIISPVITIFILPFTLWYEWWEEGMPCLISKRSSCCIYAPSLTVPQTWTCGRQKVWSENGLDTADNIYVGAFFFLQLFI